MQHRQTFQEFVWAVCVVYMCVKHEMILDLQTFPLIASNSNPSQETKQAPENYWEGSLDQHNQTLNNLVSNTTPRQLLDQVTLSV